MQSASIYARIQRAFVDLDNQLPGHQFGSSLQTFFISSGFRGAIVEKAQLMPVIDFVLEHGRAGLIAIFFANLDLNRDVMETLLGQGKHGEAGRFIADPFAQGSRATIDNLIIMATTYINSRIGEVSFPSAVAMMDNLATHFVPRHR